MENKGTTKYVYRVFLITVGEPTREVLFTDRNDAQDYCHMMEGGPVKHAVLNVYRWKIVIED